MAKCYCTKLKCARKQFITNELLVEAAGVELFRVLITRNLLIPGTATTAKKAPLPDPLYVYCTKNSRADSGKFHTVLAVSHRFAGFNGKNTSLHFSSVRYSAPATGLSPIRRVRARSIVTRPGLCRVKAEGNCGGVVLSLQQSQGWPVLSEETQAKQPD
jgi:hypothetical protein